MPERGRRAGLEWAAACVLLVALACGPGEPEERDVEPASPVTAAEDRSAWVGRAVCSECHADEAARWAGSDHDLAMQEARDDTVLGDFDDAAFDHHGERTEFFRRPRGDGSGPGFFVRTAGEDGRTDEYEVKYTFGVHPLQQYLVSLDRGRLQALTVAWDVERGRWYSVFPEPTPPGDVLHWTSRALNWNAGCADCHSTDLRRGYDFETRSYDTTWAEIDVSCEACHGPGAAHVAWARSGEGDRALPAAFAADAPRIEIETCAPCHSRRHLVSTGYRPGDPLLDHYLPALLREDLYFADGQIREEVYVHGSFVQSPMYHRGVRCSDCHDPHSLALRAEGDAVCTQCHQPTPPARFPTLTACLYDDPSHHFHEPGPGSACVDCHMPERTYMGVDPRRDHGLRIPRPDLSARIGAPDVCLGCHADRDAAWATAEIVRRHPSGRVALAPPHFADELVAARAGAPDGNARMVALARARDQAAIVRATAVDELRRRPDGDSLAGLLEAVDDEDALVRATALTTLASVLPPEMPPPLAARVAAGVAPHLDDARRAVRLEAVRVASMLPPDSLPDAWRTSFRGALAEFEAVHRAAADAPESWLDLAVVQARLGRSQEAEASYRNALTLDPAFLPARFNLATLFNAQGRNEEAERELRAILRYAPEDGDAHYSLGLLLAEMERLDEAELHLSEASKRLPDRARVRYNHALALRQLGRSGEAEAALVAAAGIDPSDPSIRYTLAVLCMERGAWADARPHAEWLVERMPDAPGPQRMLAEIDRQLAGAAPESPR